MWALKEKKKVGGEVIPFMFDACARRGRDPVGAYYY